MAKNSRQDLEKQFGNGIAPVSTKNSKKTTKKVETKKKTKKEDKKKKKKKSTPESTKLSELVKSIDSGSDIAKGYDTEEYNKEYESLSKKQKAKANEAAAKSLDENKKWEVQLSREKARSESNPILSKSFDEQLKRQKELTFNPSMEDRMNIKENYGVSSEKNPYSKNYDKTVRENAVTPETKAELNKNINESILTGYLKNYYEQENQNASVAEKILSPLTQAGTLFTGTAKLMGYQQYKDSKGLVHYLPDKLDLNYEKNKEKINSWVGKELYETAGSATKILASEAINLIAPGGGTGLYWASMAGDNVGEATNKLTAKGEKRYDKVALNAAFKTYLEYWSGKTLGSATKGLTGGKFSELDTGVTNAVYNLLDKLKVPETLKFKIAKGVGTRFSEGAEEFMQHPLENIIDIVTLGDDGKHDNVIEMLKDPETWLGALKAFGQGAATAGIVEDVNVVTNPSYYTQGAM